MKVSIITINYNNVAGLEKTINSVISNDLYDIEYIVIDGNSTDGSIDVIKKYESKINFWISKPDSGIYNAMNKGIRQATGQYILFVNSGDVIKKDCDLQSIISQITGEDIVYFDMEIADSISNTSYIKQYPNNPDFKFKKPVLNGSLVQMYGDNVYHTDPKTGEIIQEPCAHSKKDNSVNEDHLKRDWKGQFVLYSKHFYYFGDKCPLIPKELRFICCPYRNYSFKDVNDDFVIEFVNWLEDNYTIGIHGDPINWKQFNLPKLNIYDDGIR